MAESVHHRRWSYRALYILIALVVIFVHILPFRVGDARLPGPDILTLLAFAWVMRRPGYVPAPLVGLVILATDVLFMRPLGLWAGIVVLGVEFLRAREHMSRDLPFLVEWLMVAATLLVMTLANALVLAIFLVDQTALGLTFLQMIVSILTYPVVVAISRFALGVHKIAPGEMNAMGL